MPKDLAIASCCILLPELNAERISWLSPISLVKAAMSLFNAACLAPSKLISFPVSNSACNSFAIDDSKSSNVSAIFSFQLQLN